MTDPSQELAIVLASGGMDSCVTAAVAADRGYRLALLHASYGQRTQARELRSFRALAEHFGAEATLLADIGYLAAIGGSSLTDERIAVPGAGSDAPGAIPPTYVPFRNTHLIAIAVSWAEVIGAHRIFIGVVEEDASGYPDCRAEYIEEINRLIALGTRPETEVRVEAPLIAMTKPEIVRLGAELGAPLELTWSCYRSEEAPCGNCASCELRARAFREAGVADPILGGADGPDGA